MSNWSTYSDEIKARLTTLEYSEQVDEYDIQNSDASNVFLHKGYSIKVIAIQRESIIADNAYHTYKVELKISFRNTLTNTRDSNFAAFDDLITELINGGLYFPNFVSLSDDPAFIDEDVSLQTSIGTIQMWYGMRGC